VLVVQLTPPGRSAVATILVEGASAAELVKSLVRTRSGRPLTEYPEDRLIVAHFAREDGEEIVVRRRSAKSVELHCHGGYAAVEMIMATLMQKGCRLVAWQEWLDQSQADPIVAAALRALAEAPTQRTAAILLDQYHGAFGRAFNEIQTAIDQKDFAAARRDVDALMAFAPLGLHLTRPWRVVVAGRPNVGKSSLINALVGYGRSIVHHAPGTTRDAVTVTTAMDGWPVELCDTAGLHAEAEGIEKAGVDLARQRIADADLVVLVFDLSVKWSTPDQSLLEALPHALLVHNKNDLSHATDNRPVGLLTSALTGAGIDELINKITGHLVPTPPPPGAAVPFTAEQIEQLQQFARILENAL
jgi:tRNA modification GTPase